MDTQPITPKSQEAIDDETYSAKDYNKKIFSFSKQELTELQPFEDVTKFVQVQLSIGQIAQKAKDNYVGTIVLDRLGIKKSEDSKFNYDLSTGRIIVYEPRLWCSMCDKKRAEYQYQSKIYCKICIEVLRSQQGNKIEEVKEKKKKQNV